MEAPVTADANGTENSCACVVSNSSLSSEGMAIAATHPAAGVDHGNGCFSGKYAQMTLQDLQGRR